MPNHALIVAAGQGRRFGKEKQFTRIHGRPVLIHTLLVFQECQKISTITLVVPASRLPYAKKLMKTWGITKITHIQPGGKRRQDSVLKALTTMKGKKGVVVVHDGVRPCLTPALLLRGIRLCQKHKALIPVRPVPETIKKVKNNKVIRTIPRKNLYLAQTPQFFNINLLLKAYTKANKNVEYTDDAAVVEALGVPVYCFAGDETNIKITHKKDLELCVKIMA